MLRIWHHYQLNNTWDISWTICSSVGLLLLIFILFAFLKTVQHIHCIFQLSATEGLRHKHESRHFKLYSTLSAIFAAITAVFTFSMFPVCAQWECQDTWIGIMYEEVLWNCYFLCKLFLYLVFIGRLFNPHFVRIYHYPKCIRYLLRLLLMVLIITMMAWNISERIAYPASLDFIVLVVYGTGDCTLSILLLILFFRPIWTRYNVSAAVYMSLVRNYAVLSALQLIVAASAQITNLVWFYLYATVATRCTLALYGDACRVLMMLDCLLLIICIYSGFAREETVFIRIWISTAI